MTEKNKLKLCLLIFSVLLISFIFLATLAWINTFKGITFICVLLALVAFVGQMLTIGFLAKLSSKIK